MTDGGGGDTADPRADHAAVTVSAQQRSASDATAGGATDVVADADDRQTAVSVDGIRKQFGEGVDAVTAVDGVSFDLAQGSVTGVLGPNGAGKTTLIKCILGMVLPDEGRVEILGQNVLEDPRAAYTHVDAMLEGARNDYWRLTVRENLRYFTTISGVDPDSVADRHDRILRQLDLTEKADTPVRDLSRGMKQKVSLASVLAGGAEVVFLDEPTLGLDVESSRTLQRELRRLVEEEDLTVVLSSHDMDVIETVCDRVIIMSDGGVVADDTVEALLRGGDVHAVQITSPDFDESLVGAIRQRVDLRSVESVDDGDATRIEAAVDSDGLYELLAFLRGENVTLRAVRTVEPDLEDVFVSLTGLEGGER